MFGAISFVGFVGGAFSFGCLMGELTTTNDPKTMRILLAITIALNVLGITSLVKAFI